MDIILNTSNRRVTSHQLAELCAVDEPTLLRALIAGNCVRENGAYRLYSADMGFLSGYCAQHRQAPQRSLNPAQRQFIDSQLRGKLLTR